MAVAAILTGKACQCVPRVVLRFGELSVLDGAHSLQIHTVCTTKQLNSEWTSSKSLLKDSGVEKVTTAPLWAQTSCQGPILPLKRSNRGPHIRERGKMACMSDGISWKYEYHTALSDSAGC